MNSIYAIGPANGPYKVGIARSVERRLMELQTGSPAPLRVHAVRHHASYADEGIAHKALAGYRIHGEWFDAPLDQICERAGLTPTTAPPAKGVTAGAFCRFLGEMERAPFKKSEAEVRDMLGLADDDLATLKSIGGSPHIALACRALLHRLEPYA